MSCSTTTIEKRWIEVVLTLEEIVLTSLSQTTYSTLKQLCETTPSSMYYRCKRANKKLIESFVILNEKQEFDFGNFVSSRGIKVEFFETLNILNQA